MIKRLLAALALFTLVSTPAWAHRLDEYLQATLFLIAPGKVQATMRLVPGVAVASVVVADIDSNHDGVLSSQEQQAYARRVLGDLALKEDGKNLQLHLGAATFPPLDQMKQGTGEIELTFSADLVSSPGEHQLTFANHHQTGISVYLVNSLVPQDKSLTLSGQSRNQDQTFYQLTLTEGKGAPPQGFTWSGFASAFRLGIRHIAEGSDHLLFLFTLLLPAPLLAAAGRWSGRATNGQSLIHVLGIVTAFTLGHSLTLALSGLGLVHLPSQPVEVLIAISILVSAIHALRPLFPGREAVIAGGLGLIHGLAFATALNELGMTGWYRLISLLGFNLGIETMQLAAVAMVLPPLLLLGQRNSYGLLRTVGATGAAIVSSTWIAERVFSRPNLIGNAIERVAHYGAWLAALLWLLGALTLFISRYGRTPAPESRG